MSESGCRGLLGPLWWSCRTFSRTLAGTDPEPRLVAGARACARLGVPDLEARFAQHGHVGAPAVVTPHHRRPPSFPVLFAALVVRYGHGRKESASRPEPAVDALQKRGLFGAWKVDYGVEGNHGVAALWGENDFGHIRFQESAFGDVSPGQLQLSRRDVNTRNGESSVGEPACHRHSRTAAKVEYDGLRR